LKKSSKKLLLNGFGLSAEAQPEFAKVFWFLFSKKNILSSLVETLHEPRRFRT
jgi:hypothetical protein